MLLVFFDTEAEHPKSDDPDGRRIEFVYDDHGVYWRE